MAAETRLLVPIPDSRIAREATELIRDTESDLLFHHSTRVYQWGSLLGLRLCRMILGSGWRDG